MLDVQGLSSPGRVRDVSFTLKAGEVLGFSGLVGSGRSEVAAALFGLDPAAHGTVRLDGKAIRVRHPRDAIALGFGLVPEDRKRQGIIPAEGSRRNMALSVLGRAPRRAWTRDPDAMEYARALASLGDLDDALAALREHTESADATRLLVDLASQGGRFPEALAAARRLSEMNHINDTEARQSRVLVRALTRLVADADAVRAPHTNTAFRRALSLD